MRRQPLVFPGSHPVVSPSTACYTHRIMLLSPYLRSCADCLRHMITNLFLTAPKNTSVASDRRWELEASQRVAFLNARIDPSPELDRVDDRTWAELELDKVLIRLDQSVTPLGTQSLYALLNQYHSFDALEGNRNTYAAFASNLAISQQLREALGKLNTKECSDLANFVLGQPVALPARYKTFYLASILALLCPFGLLISHWFLFPTVGLWIANVCIHSIYGRKIGVHSAALACMAMLLSCLPKVNLAIRDLKLLEVQHLESLSIVANDLRRKISRVFLRMHGGNDLSQALIEYLNLLCLFELSFSCRAIVAINQQRSALARILKLIGRLDAFQGLATTLPEYSFLCTPQLEPGRSFSLVDVFHPLVDKPIAITIEGAGKSVLLSGTNMSGKTTFMKTIGINVIMSQTLGFCFARSAILPPARIKSLIRREDPGPG